MWIMLIGWILAMIVLWGGYYWIMIRPKNKGGLKR